MNYISPIKPSVPSATPCHTRMGEGGRVIVPATMRKALGLAVGESLVMRMEGDEIRIYSLQQAITRAQQMVAKYDKNKDKSVVDELIDERRREAMRERE